MKHDNSGSSKNFQNNRFQQNQRSPHFSGKGKGKTGGKCHGCGGDHERTSCPHRDKVCSQCGKKGHLQRVCKSRGKGAHEIHEENSDPPDEANLAEWSSSGEDFHVLEIVERKKNYI